ncbi:MAG: DUF5362 family protein [Caldicoprobacterales bacterium]|jgi:hypothetical protein|nr:DUF5362 domain-containing protein [Clostridiales bacterium]
MLNKQELSDMGKWAGFLGIINIIGGVLGCISIVGLIPGIIAIILGLKLRGAKRYADEAVAAPDGVTETSRLNLMISDLSAFFKIQGILIIISLVLSIIGVILFATAGYHFYSNMPYYY